MLSSTNASLSAHHGQQHQHSHQHALPHQSVHQHHLPQQQHHSSQSNGMNNTTAAHHFPQQQQQHVHQDLHQHHHQPIHHHNQHHHSHHRQDEEKLRQRAEQRAKDIAKNQEHITYSARYYDDLFEYRHVSLPKVIARYVPNELMTEEEWRSLGVKQSQGWEHYMIHAPEPHVLLFKREKDYQAKYLNGPKQA
ncbi:cyclin-dependent kinase regulatory subunit CKS1 [Entomortierella parvispora]|uniref:Cyclin-dependent kinases regulatory subunit n=1 Tax=Entomortierella parvispora TaxID=205924 RepID=A0A9P3HIR5_9FUNG|nr:cyclin-dependent kinase regulatory subunit CKS1 [Entomortierella parvispora]